MVSFVLLSSFSRLKGSWLCGNSQLRTLPLSLGPVAALSFDSPNLSGTATAGYGSPTLFDSPTPSPTPTPPPPASNERTEALHTVTFTCIGATRAQSYQKTLLKARDLMDQKEVVLVRLTPEPNNPRDKRATAFQCNVEDTWHTVGCVVRELLEEVHQVMQANLITAVTFKWIKFIFSRWPNSTPGFYAGVEVTRKGQWSSHAVVCASII